MQHLALSAPLRPVSAFLLRRFTRKRSKAELEAHAREIESSDSVCTPKEIGGRAELVGGVRYDSAGAQAAVDRDGRCLTPPSFAVPSAILHGDQFVLSRQYRIKERNSRVQNDRESGAEKKSERKHRRIN